MSVQTGVSITATPDEHSDAYKKLIEDETQDDEVPLVGIIAYSLYKKEKREFIIRCRLKHGDAEVKNYHYHLNDTHIQSLKSQAEAILADYAENVRSFFENEVREETKNSELLSSIKQEIKDNTKVSTSIVAGVISSVVFGLLLTAAAVIQWQNPMNAFIKHTATNLESVKEPPLPASGNASGNK